MKQVLQDLANGNTSVVETPAPQVSFGNILIYTTTSLISVGTERMLVDFGKASLIDKARQQPDKVKMVLEKVKTDGLCHARGKRVNFYYELSRAKNSYLESGLICA